MGEDFAREKARDVDLAADRHDASQRRGKFVGLRLSLGSEPSQRPEPERDRFAGLSLPTGKGGRRRNRCERGTQAEKLGIGRESTLGQALQERQAAMALEQKLSQGLRLSRGIEIER